MKKPLDSVRRPWLTAMLAGACTLSLALVACGGGSGNESSSKASGAAAGATSSGTITAFGSVFVNGHEFDTSTATLIDDDTGQTSSEALEVGMVVDVKAAQHSRADHPAAAEVHLHPLARGIVDASDTAAGTLTVMGQAVQLTAATVFNDRRACVSDTAAPCTAVTGQSGLSVTAAASGSAANTPGSYVTVHGYLYSSATAGSAAQIVATLVSVRDVPSDATGAAYKAEGVVTAVDATANTVTIGGLTVDLSLATCYKVRTNTACAGAYAVGEVVSAFAAAQPTLPAVTLVADKARLRSKTVVETDGAAIELEGRISSVSTADLSFVLRGVTVDASALGATALPAVGEGVRVLGTVATGGTKVTATSVTVLQAAPGATYGLEADFTGATAGATSGTYVLQLLGQSVTVDADTRLADRSTGHDRGLHDTSKAFNITTFESYLTASASKHLRVTTRKDSAGALRAMSVTIVPASTAVGLSGVVDTTPAPVNGSAESSTTFSVLGIPVSAVPSAVVSRAHHGSGSATATIAAGDLVLVRGSWAEGTLVVAAPTSGSNPTATAIVIDMGQPSSEEHGCF